MSEMKTLIEILDRLRKIDEISNRLDDLESRINELSKAKGINVNDLAKAITEVLAKSTSAETAEASTKNMLEKAAELAILHYKVEPPKRRGR